MAKSLQDYDFFSEEVLECPFDFYKLARPPPLPQGTSPVAQREIVMEYTASTI